MKKNNNELIRINKMVLPLAECVLRHYEEKKNIIHKKLVLDEEVKNRIKSYEKVIKSYHKLIRKASRLDINR